MLKQHVLLLAVCASSTLSVTMYAAQNEKHAETVVAQSNQGAVCEGTIYDSEGEPLVGVTVMVKGTTNATMTDIDGKFSLKNVPLGSILTISSVGFQSLEITWTGTKISQVLQEDLHGLDEVVVVGYGTQKKVNVTGAVSAIGSEAIEARPVANVQQALQGVIPGLNVTIGNSGGELNTVASLNVRGTGSLNSNDAPLVLIDGIEGSLALLNPNDIESVSVLKDAASASIYGSRAAFGVILVTTKSGKAGKTRITYSGDLRFSTATNLPQMLDSYTFAKYWNTASVNNGKAEVFTQDILDKIQKYQRGEYTDPSKPEYYGTSPGDDGYWAPYYLAFANTSWYDQFYSKNVPSTQHNISLNGGSEKAQWLLSGSYLGQRGLLKPAKDDVKRYTFDAKIGAQVVEGVRLDYSTRWTRNTYTKPNKMTALFFHNIARRWPTNPVYDPNGHYFPGMELEELVSGGQDTYQNLMHTQQLKLTVTPTKGWNITLAGSMQNTNYKEYKAALPVYHYDVLNRPYLNANYGTVATITDYRSRSNYYTVNVFTDYTREIGKHYTRGLLGLNYEEWDTDSMTGSGTDLTDRSAPYLSQTQRDPSVTDAYWHRAVAGYFGRINYVYDERFLLELNLRYDGSSRFIGDKRWAWFPSVSTGWNIANESFFSSLKNQIEILKLRASWGTLGNTNAYYGSFSAWYPFYQQLPAGVSNSGWLIEGAKQNTASMPGLVTTTLTWETIRTWNLGVDWNTLRGRLTGSFDWFLRNTKDMIGPVPELGSALGVNAPQENNCDMQSVGWELEVSWRDRIQDVNYGVRVNLSDATQKVTKYFNQTGTLSSYYEGRKLGEIWGYETAGIAQTDAEMNTWLAKNKPNWGSGWAAGDIMYKDLDGNGEVNSGAYTLSNHGDLKIIGNSTPRYRIGISADAAYKGVDFSIFFQGVLKRDYFFGSGQPYFWGANVGMWQAAAFKEHLDYWSPENRGAYYPRPLMDGGGKNAQPQTRYLQDASYLRCKNIQLGYTIPRSILEKINVEKCRVYVSCENLFTITSLSKIFDPEVVGGSWGAGKTYPLQRVVSVGTTVQF